MNERIVSIGSIEPLSGIVTRPATAARVGVVLLNAGVLHRVGANRLNVTLARRLAALGMPALRFDAGGLGESGPRGPRATPHAPEVADTLEAVEFLCATERVDRCVLVGLCSGAEAALRTAAASPRVVGVVALEGYAYPTREFWLRRYAARMLRPSGWQRLWSYRRLLRRFGDTSDTPAGLHDGPFSLRAALGGRRLPPQEESAALFASLVERELPILAAYAGGEHHYYNYTRQLRAAFPSVRFGTLLDVLYEPHADHTFSDTVIRRRLVSEIEAWMRRRGFAAA